MNLYSDLRDAWLPWQQGLSTALCLAPDIAHVPKVILQSVSDDNMTFSGQALDPHVGGFCPRLY